jgi:hypothetical protein
MGVADGEGSEQDRSLESGRDSVQSTQLSLGQEGRKGV